MLSKRAWISAAGIACALLISDDTSGRGRGGGGFGGGSRPSFSGGGGGASRPSIGGGGVSRPNVSVPSAGLNRPSTLPNYSNRPSGGISGGNFGGGNVSRPNLPEANRPSGGLKPSTGIGNFDRPATQPGRPNLGENRPNTSVPGLGGNRPGNIGRPDGGITGKVGGGNIGGRPSPGDLGDFLGMPGGVRPDQGSGLGNKLPNSKIGGGKQGGDRPIFGDDRPSRDRPINIGNQVNNNINVRPTWANIDNNRFNNIQGNYASAIKNQTTFNNWLGKHPDRRNYWRGWGDGVRSNWGHYHNHYNWFNQRWWEGHNHAYCGWHYHYSFYGYNWSYWWRTPTWANLSGWFAWTAAPASVWSQPIYYDYGTGGNVIYQDNRVYLGGQEVATSQEFAQSAATLATVSPPASQAEAEKAEWMPLGTFAVATHAKDVDPSRIIQLAVNKQGVISGTLYNKETDKAQSIQGQVDKQTQRVAFRFGDSDKIVAETGLFNLTQDEVPVMVHFAADKVENYLLVRLKQDADSQSKAAF